MLLSGRVRQVEETEIIQGIIEKIFKRKVDEGKLFEGDLFNETFGTTLQVEDLEEERGGGALHKLVFARSSFIMKIV